MWKQTKMVPTFGVRAVWYAWHLHIYPTCFEFCAYKILLCYIPGLSLGLGATLLGAHTNMCREGQEVSVMRKTMYCDRDPGPQTTAVLITHETREQGYRDTRQCTFTHLRQIY